MPAAGRRRGRPCDRRQWPTADRDRAGLENSLKPPLPLAVPTRRAPAALAELAARLGLRYQPGPLRDAGALADLLSEMTGVVDTLEAALPTRRGGRA